MQLKIGDLARKAGLTVRTLHHYDDIGLLSPSARSKNGFRLYSDTEVIRLYRIQALKQLGFPLDDISALLQADNLSQHEVITRQIKSYEEQMQRTQALKDRLQNVLAEIAKGQNAEYADWLSILEMTALYERYFSDAELIMLRRHRDNAGKAIYQKWAKLIPEVQTAKEKNLPPKSEEAQELAWRWKRLIVETTGNDMALAFKMMQLLEAEPRMQQLSGTTPAMIQWIGESFSYARARLFARYLSDGEVSQLAQRLVEHASMWPPLVAAVRQKMKTGTRATDDSMRELAYRWKILFRANYCGTDMEVEKKIRFAFQQEPDLHIGMGTDAAMMAFIESGSAYDQNEEN